MNHVFFWHLPLNVPYKLTRQTIFLWSTLYLPSHPFPFNITNCSWSNFSIHMIQASFSLTWAMRWALHSPLLWGQQAIKHTWNMIISIIIINHQHCDHQHHHHQQHHLQISVGGLPCTICCNCCANRRRWVKSENQSDWMDILRHFFEDEHDTQVTIQTQSLQLCPIWWMVILIQLQPNIIWPDDPVYQHAVLGPTKQSQVNPFGTLTSNIWPFPFWW